MKLAITLLVVHLLAATTLATIDEAMEAVLVRTEPLHELFESAKQAAAKDQYEVAATSIGKAEALIRKEQAASVVPHGASLGQAADQLKVLAEDVSAGETSEEEMDIIFANTHTTLANFYLGKSERSAAKGDRGLAGAALIASANHVEKSANWAGRKLSDGSRSTVSQLRKTGASVINGAGDGLKKLGGVFKKGSELVGKVRTRNQVVQKSSAIVVGEDHVFQLDTPSGWILDSESGLEHGLVALFYAEGKTWESAKVFAYSSTVTRDDQIKTVEDAVASFVASYQESGHDAYKATKQEPLPLPSGKTAPLYRFGGDAFGNHEIIAFFPEKKTINFVVLTGPKEGAFDKAQPTFRELASSYQYISDDPSKVEEHIQTMMGENWREELPGEVKTPLRKKKKVRRHK